MGSRFVKIGIIQPYPVCGSYKEFRKGGDVQHACDMLMRFKGQADVVCFPELYPGTGERELARKAQELKIYVIAGIIEKTSKGCYNTATIFDRDGVIVGRQRKKYPTLREVERDGIIAGNTYEIFQVDTARIGIVICADLPFFSDWQPLIESKADIILNLSRWFALSDAYPATIIARHLEFGIPVIGINWAKFSFPEWKEIPNGFPPAGGHSTIAIPPPVTNLKELADWFRTKKGGIDSSEDFVTVLGEKEETAIVTIDIQAVRDFPGYFYNEQKVPV
jgi:predicted amidohydrolase